MFTWFLCGLLSLAWLAGRTGWVRGSTTVTILEPGAYVVTPEDRLWLLRAVEGEGAPKALVAQALVNRFVWLLQRPRAPYGSLASFVRAYSQPVNPRHMKGGDKWDAAWQRGTAAQRRALELKHQRRVAHSARVEFAPSTVDAVDRALQRGPLDLPTPSTTDFARSGEVYGSHLYPTLDPGPGSNAFYEVDPKWAGYRVKGRTGGAGVLLAAGFAVLWFVHGTRR